MKNYNKIIEEAFGEPIGMYAGDAPEGVRSIEEADICPVCGMMPVDGKCGCAAAAPVQPSAVPVEPTDDVVCPKCGMIHVHEADMCEMSEKKMNETELEEVTPAGYEKVVKALKKEPEIDNPWAIAWSMKEKGIKPKK